MARPTRIERVPPPSERNVHAPDDEDELRVEASGIAKHVWHI